MKFEIDTDNFRFRNDFDMDHRWGFEIRMVNEPEYCGKFLVLERDVTSSLHYHKGKKETFIVLSGDVSIESNGCIKVYHPGDKLTIGRGVRHRFVLTNNTKVLFLEVSEHHDDADVFRLVGSGGVMGKEAGTNGYSESQGRDKISEG